MRYGRLFAARKAGACAQCHAGTVVGQEIYWAFGVRRGSGWVMCEPCGTQYERDLAADDFDLSNNSVL